MARQPPSVEVHWLDIEESSSWDDEDEVLKAPLPKCITKGFLRNKDWRATGKLVISSTYSPSDRKGNRTTIPVGCVTALYQARRGRQIPLNDTDTKDVEDSTGA